MTHPPDLPPHFAYGVTMQLGQKDEIDEIIAEILINGFAVFESGLDSGSIDQVRSAIDAVYQAQVEEMGGEETLRKMKDGDNARAILAYDPIFLKVAACPSLMNLCARLLGNEFVLLMQNAIINRPDRENYQKLWHRDLNYQHWTSSSVLAVSALFCADDFTRDNGATFVLQGTQNVKEFPTLKFCRQFERQITAPAGSFLMFNSMLFHRGGLNRSTGARRAINHVIGLPIFAQQIDLPKLLKSRNQPIPESPEIQKYLGFRWSPADSVIDWRNRHQV
jgi:ectoine hydroxylase-related dioxygenase (phytanoyl-CoA dioxygenase family)